MLHYGCCVWLAAALAISAILVIPLIIVGVVLIKGLPSNDACCICAMGTGSLMPGCASMIRGCIPGCMGTGSPAGSPGTGCLTARPWGRTWGTAVTCRGMPTGLTCLTSCTPPGT